MHRMTIDVKQTAPHDHGGCNARRFEESQGTQEHWRRDAMAMSDGARWNKYGGTPADVYERYLVPAIFVPWSDVLLDTAAPRPGERVLDVACGTGIVARRSAERVWPGGRVAGIDLNAAMLAAAHCRQHLLGRGGYRLARGQRRGDAVLRC
jgi:SAM-dependent methyltransferase